MNDKITPKEVGAQLADVLKENEELKAENQKLKSNLDYLISAFQTIGGAVDMAKKVRF